MVSALRQKLCTEKTEGTVVRHKYYGEGRIFPEVEYTVQGVLYKTKKKFRGINYTFVSGVPIKPPKAALYEDDKGYLHVQGRYISF